MMKFWKDPSFWLVMGANAVTLVQATVQHSLAGDVLWTFWLQSLVIGVFAVIRLFRLGAWFYGLFFVFHYGFFHVIYGFFLSEFSFPGVAPLLLSVVAFIIAHGTSAFVVYPPLTRGTDREDAMVVAFIRPYARIVPMHLTLIFCTGFFGGGEVLGLLLLKALVDGATHIGIHSKDLVYADGV